MRREIFAELAVRQSNIGDQWPKREASGAQGKEDKMSPVKVAAVVLIVAGVLALLYGSFSYTKETHDVKVGPVEVSVKEKQTVNVPVWGWASVPS